MTPPLPPKEDASWVQLKEYEVSIDFPIARLSDDEMCSQAALQHLDAHLTAKIEIRTELEHIRKDV